MKRENPEAGSPLSAEPNSGLDLRAVRSRPEPRLRVRCLSNCATKLPLFVELLSLPPLVMQATKMKTAHNGGQRDNFYKSYTEAPG